MSEKAGSTHVAFLVYRLWWIGGILHGTAAVRVICCSVVSVMPVIFCFMLWILGPYTRYNTSLRTGARNN